MQDKTNWLVSYPDDGNAVCYGMEDSSFWYQHRNQCILNAIQEAKFKNAFFDIGGGNGVTAQVLQNHGYDVTLVEPYQQGIENASARGIKKVIQSTLEDFADTSPQIDGVGIFDVMEHIEDDAAFLHYIHGTLKPGGKLILTVPAFQALWSDNDLQLGHYRRYRLEDLEKLLVRQGFKVTYQTYFFSLVWLPMWILRVIPNKFGITKKNTPQKKQKEHMAGNPVTAKILRWLLSWEIRLIKMRKKIPLGTSCLVIAEK